MTSASFGNMFSMAVVSLFLLNNFLSDILGIALANDNAAILSVDDARCTQRHS
jgi:hypothetical protein